MALVYEAFWATSIPVEAVGGTWLEGNVAYRFRPFIESFQNTIVLSFALIDSN